MATSTMLKNTLGGKGYIEVDYWQWKKKSESLGKELISYAKVTIKEIAEAMFKVVKARTPKPGIQYTRDGGQRTSTDIGKLWNMDHQKSATREKFIMKNLYPNQDVILYFEEGTKPHQIRPKRSGGFLNFYTSRGFVKTRGVEHPGTEAHRMIGGAIDWAESLIDSYESGVIQLVRRIMARTAAVQK